LKAFFRRVVLVFEAVVKLSYRYLDHGADIGLEAKGGTLEEVFLEAGRGLFSLMANLEKVHPQMEFLIEVSGEDREELFYEWLAELLSRADLERTVFCQFELSDIDRGEEGEYRLSASVKGGKFASLGTEPLVEVKAVTYLGLEVTEIEEGWRARCVLDV